MGNGAAANEATAAPQRSADYLGEYKMFIDGAWVEAAHRGSMTVVDPASGLAVAQVARGDADDASAAVAAARRAFDEGPWPGMSAVERAPLLHAAASLLRERIEHLAKIETLEMGKLLDDGRGDMSRVANLLDHAADLAVRKLDQQTVAEPASSVREPVGVVVGITPWNFPLVLGAFKFAYALAAGNAVIIKPASISPLTTLEMARIFDEVELPKGVFQVVVGPGGSTGEVLVTSPLVDMVTLTGSVEVGVQIMRDAAQTVKRVGLELGGKSPNIVFADADLETAVQGVMFSVFGNAGQVCCAGTRLLVERSVHDRFVGELVRRAKAIRVGPGLDPHSRMGPLSSPTQVETVERYVAIGLAEGARLACGGKPLEGGGCFFQPTIFVDVANTMQIAQEEIFGPVLVVIPFDTEEEAISIANDTKFGLAAGVWTQDRDKALRCARGVRSGTFYVNSTWACAPIELPWGGYKQSGLGREIGESGLDEFTEVKSVIFDTSGGEPMGLYPAPE
jgi:betaine-aldehyde dehydrogenase